MLEELERGHGGYTVLCLSCETPQPGFFHRQLDMLWPAQQEGIDQSLAAATLGFTPCRQALASHTEMVRSLCCQPSARGSCRPTFTVTAHSWFVQTPVCAPEHLARAELLLSSRTALLAHWDSSRRAEVPRNAGCPFLVLEVRWRC